MVFEVRLKSYLRDTLAYTTMAHVEIESDLAFHIYDVVSYRQDFIVIQDIVSRALDDEYRINPTNSD